MDKVDLDEKAQWLASSEEPPHGKVDRAVELSRKRPKIVINIILFIMTPCRNLVR